MIIYKDMFCGDEMVTDSYKFELIEDAVFKVKSKRVTEDGGIDESLLGANPSAEEAAEGTQESAVTNYDLVFNHQLVETTFTKKQYMTYIKEYMKNVKKRLEESNSDRLGAFQKGAQVFIKDVLSNFDDFQFFMGTSMNPDGMMALCRYESDGNPYFYFFKDGLEEEKA